MGVSWGLKPPPPGSVHCAPPTAAVAEAPSPELRLSPGVTETSPKFLTVKPLDKVQPSPDLHPLERSYPAPVTKAQFLTSL